MSKWATRAERPEDIAAIREINLSAFPTALEADLVEALRADPKAWIQNLSILSVDEEDTPVGYALFTRCAVGGLPALALAPCAVKKGHQNLGAGSAAIRHGLQVAAQQGENLVVVLGHPEYYPRFGFAPASTFGITAPFEAPDEAFLALSLDPATATPRGAISYPAAFGI